MTPNTARAASYPAFWSEIAPCEHLVQMYANDEALLGALEGFVRGGVEKGEVVMLLATPTQLSALNMRLAAQGFDLEGARSRQLYITVDANESLHKFMVRNWPDESLLQHFIHTLVARANGRPVRVFSGMQSLLMACGHSTAVLRLEQLWHKLCDRYQLALFCAYPRKDFGGDLGSALRAISATHSCVVPSG